MKSTALITLALIFNQHLGAASLMQTVTLDTVELIASGSLSGGSDETIGVSFPAIELVFNQFDPGLGTLDQVTFDLNYSYTGSFTTSSLTSSVSGFDTNSGFNISLSIEVNDVDVFGIGSGAGTISTTPDEVAELTASISSTDLVLGTLLDEIGLAGLGTALYRITPSAFFGNDLFNVSGYFTDYSVQRDAGLTMTVTYDYTPVPEPRAYSMIIGIIVLCGVALRRRRGA